MEKEPRPVDIYRRRVSSDPVVAPPQHPASLLLASLAIGCFIAGAWLLYFVSRLGDFTGAASITLTVAAGLLIAGSIVFSCLSIGKDIDRRRRYRG